MALDQRSFFQRSVFTSGRGYSYFGQTPGLPLSLKCMANGRALYRFGRAEVAVDDGGYLILNDRQPYSIEIASPTLVETFVLWFPPGWAGDACRSANDSTGRLLDEPEPGTDLTASFHSRYTPHDQNVSPRVQRLRTLFKGTPPITDGWLEDQLRGLLAAMLASQRPLRRQVDVLPALRASTREELWRRVSRARDYLHARVGEPVTLSDAAAAACLSPFHLLRVFHAAFGLTPHQYLSRCRLERARFLVEKTALSVTDICLECGFTSLGSFSTLFQRKFALSPRAWRKRHGRVPTENRKIREEYLTGAG